ncbi:hypothetical protein Dimus_011869 [Dionaea muscipula]
MLKVLDKSESAFFPYISFAMGTSESAFPVTQKQLCVDINGDRTDIILSRYDDHFLVIATQIGTMGTMLQARKEEGVTAEPTFSVMVVFGKRDEPLLVACARQLIEHITKSGTSRSLVLSLGLKDHSVETVKAISSVVIENRLW